MIRSNDQNAPKNLRLDEKTGVENPLLDQLQTQGWAVLRLEMSASPSASHRADFKEVVIRSELVKALVQIKAAPRRRRPP